MTNFLNSISSTQNASEISGAYERLRAEQAATCAPKAQNNGSSDDPKPQGWLKKRPKPTPVAK